jgi:hypothetical protein
MDLASINRDIMGGWVRLHILRVPITNSKYTCRQSWRHLQRPLHIPTPLKILCFYHNDNSYTLSWEFWMPVTSAVRCRCQPSAKVLWSNWALWVISNNALPGLQPGLTVLTSNLPMSSSAFERSEPFFCGVVCIHTVHTPGQRQSSS